MIAVLHSFVLLDLLRQICFPQSPSCYVLEYGQSVEQPKNKYEMANLLTISSNVTNG